MKSTQRNASKLLPITALLTLFLTQDGFLYAACTPVVTPGSATVTSQGQQQFIGTINCRNGGQIIWSATSGSITTRGLFTAPAVTKTTTLTVKAKLSTNYSLFKSVSVTVQPLPPPTLKSVALNASALSLVIGKGQQLSATATFTDNSTQDVNPSATWSSASSSIADVSTGLVTAENVGTTTVTAAFSGLSASASASVLNPPVQINALFPPMQSHDATWNDFNSFILTNPNINGVNPFLDWSTIETSQGVYDFSTLDGELQHFYDAGKKVNLIVRAVSPSNSGNPGGGVNTFTPPYVFTTAWANSQGETRPLDVVTCALYPGNGQASSGYPAVYEVPFKAAYKNFISAVLAHYANNPHVGYVRFGLSVGGEANPFCQPQLSALSANDAFSQGTWLSYVTEMDTFEASLHPTMQLMGALNQVANDPAMVYSNSEAASAVANGMGFGSQGMQASDLSNFASGQACASNWCALFDQDNAQVPLELQQATLSDPTGAGTTGSLAALIPFAVTHHVNILEIYTMDLLLAFDPNYLSLPSSNPAFVPYSGAYATALNNAATGN